jgi:HD superfamily phosphohydrolase
MEVEYDKFAKKFPELKKHIALAKLNKLNLFIDFNDLHVLKNNNQAFWLTDYYDFVEGSTNTLYTKMYKEASKGKVLEGKKELQAEFSIYLKEYIESFLNQGVDDIIRDCIDVKKLYNKVSKDWEGKFELMSTSNKIYEVELNSKIFYIYTI